MTAATRTEYELDLPGLAEVVSSCAPAPGHKALVKALQQLPGMAFVKLATTRGEDGGSYLHSRSVYGPDGSRLHEDHEVWLRAQVEADAGDFRSTYYRLQGKGYKLTKRHTATLYLVVDQGGDQMDFIQTEVWRIDERMDCELLSTWGAPSTVEELVREAAGYALPEAQCVTVGAPYYVLRCAIDVAKFLKMLEELEESKRAALRRRRYRSTNDEGQEEILTHQQLDPHMDRFPHRARRLFNDWDASSAGRSGARLCDHWVMEFQDWTNPSNGVRDMALVPSWTFDKKLAEVKARVGETHAFYGKLQTIDRRVKVPFGWYFYMLHGNRVHDESAHRVLKAAEDGLIVLPEHDYQVLRAWRERPYGF